jgi:hypothetical protein
MRGALLPLRLLLAACLAMAGLLPLAPAAPGDAALAFARAAGALCEAPGTPAAPGPAHSHEFCLACPALGGAVLPPAVLALAAPRIAPSPSDVVRAAAPADGSWPAYASRAPPGMVA